MNRLLKIVITENSIGFTKIKWRELNALVRQYFSNDISNWYLKYKIFSQKYFLTDFSFLSTGEGDTIAWNPDTICNGNIDLENGFDEEGCNSK